MNSTKKSNISDIIIANLVNLDPFLLSIKLQQASERDPDLLPNLIHETEFRDYFLSDPGREHYPLLRYISTLVEGGIFVDVGTYKGCSAVALSENISNHVYSFDIVDKNIIFPRPNNIHFHIDDVFKYSEIIHKADFILLDTDHDGIFEREFIKFLDTIKFNGIVMCDDINLNDQMKSFWSEQLTSRTCYDLTKIGHWSGTGFIIFN